MPSAGAFALSSRVSRDQCGVFPPHQNGRRIGIAHDQAREGGGINNPQAVKTLNTAAHIYDRGFRRAPHSGSAAWVVDGALKDSEICDKIFTALHRGS